MVNIKRSISSYLLILILFIFISTPMIANSQGLKVFDDGNLFTEDEIISLSEEANIISDEYDMDIIILTTDYAEGKTAREYADDYYDYNGFGLGDDKDGILFLIDMDNRELYISTSGLGNRYLTDQRREDILGFVFDSGLENGDYYGASGGFLSATKGYLKSGIPSNQYSEDEKIKNKNTLTFLEVIISFIVGSISTAIFYLSIKSKYKMNNPVKPLNFRSNSIINLVSSEDRLLDSIITQRTIPKPSKDSSSADKSTTHTSSSGKTHGGGGKSF